MTKVVTLTLSRSRDIPFNKLLLSQSNVRRTKAGVSIEELADDIARRTLLHGLSVRPVLDAGGAETGMFEVPAGGRRYRALELLVKRKRLARNALVPCVVRTEGLAEEDSLAENVQRAPLHALDQFRAFQAMVDKGLPEEEIAVAFTTTAAVVRQRLRLAAVAPALLDVYAEDGMTLDQLMAFTVNPDPERQVQVWEAIQKTYNREPYQIRRMLTEGAVRASDRRAQFVLAPYQEAGGAIMHRTIALRDALAGHPDLAFLAVLHALCLSLFNRGGFDTCLEIEAKSLAYAQQPAGLAETPCAVAIAARHQAWTDQLPRDPDRMWEALVAFDHDSRQALFAHCASLTINALHEGWNRRPRALAHADRLAQAMQLDMTAAGWAPTVEGFFSRITKGQMLDTVREAQGDEAADRIAGLKKDDMAVEAARLVEGTGWLPRPLRTAPLVIGPVSEADGADGDALIADVVQSAEIDGETAMEPQGQVADDTDGQATEPHAVAAE